MKNHVKLLLLTLLSVMFILTSCNDKSISKDELPNEIKTYLSKNFSNYPVTKVEKDIDIDDNSYEVTLQGDIVLDFDENNKIEEISSDTKLPDNIFPAGILNYVRSNYPNNYITDWEMDDNTQQIELDNGIDLEFDRNNIFKRIDD